MNKYDTLIKASNFLQSHTCDSNTLTHMLLLLINLLDINETQFVKDMNVLGRDWILSTKACSSALKIYAENIKQSAIKINSTPDTFKPLGDLCG